MKKIALISDIHSNVFALQAVLDDIAQRNIDLIYCLGDIVGYHTFPNETIDLLKSAGVVCILGNHDNDVINKRFKDDKELDIFRWTHDSLSEDNLSFLAKLPRQLEIEIEGHSIYLCHGSPDSITEYLREGEALTDQIMANFDGDILVCAHTHIPYSRKYLNKTILNTGSVGKPKIGRPNATYQILELDKSNICTEIVEVIYDFNQTANHVEQIGYVKYAQALRTGNA